MPSHEDLFRPLRVRHVELPNRIVAPPMVQLRSITSPEGIAWYRRLASGGAGLVIVESTGIPRFGDDLTVRNMAPLVNAIHSAGAKAAIQLFPIQFGGDADVDKLTHQQIQQIIRQYGVAACTCRDAGFDGVEPHGAHGFLLNQFFMPDKNHRQDEFGGTPENRTRLAVRIVEEIRKAAGDGLLVLYRHTPVAEAYTVEDSLELARRLIDAGLDILDVSPARKDSVADLAAPFKARLPVHVIAVNGMEDPQQACQALRDGRCDLIAVGRQLIADATWPRKVRQGRLAEVHRCTKCEKGCFGNLDADKPVACVLWTEDEVASFLG